jgi:uncharacterized protein (DUF302 family)
MADGLTTIPSAHSVKQTIDRLEAEVKAKGMMVFGRVDHAKGARDVDLELRPTELLLFGHPRGGTPLMQAQQTAGIDLPLRALAWEDAVGKVWLAYNAPDWIAARHGIPADMPAVKAMAGALAAVGKAAAA